ncbi:hypothetical protein GCM10009716_32300 [Streptomyces sodiiphilus]|uniref:WYL domain-containing protein n=1 Tax=Streptomyces sodiiphilus TaxID=226217 RepID=A0ABN2PGN2_9ACTN
MNEVENNCAEVRMLSAKVHQGGKQSATAFRTLAQKLLAITVMEQGQRLVLRPHTRGDTVWVLEGGHNAPHTSDAGLVKLLDGHWLKIGYLLSLTGNNRLAVTSSKIQYQWTDTDRSEVFRYDYAYEAEGRHPAAHLNLHALLPEPDGPGGPGRPLERVHFPTGRTSLEQVLRLLAQGFHVRTARPPEIWEPVLAEAERMFYEVAHQPSFTSADAA